MSTRSNICRQNLDGSYDVIYCHWDGYPSHNGKILYEHYNTPNKVNLLLMLGDLSSLAPEIGTKHDFDNRDDEYRKQHEHMCMAYGRDRGEKDCEAKHYKDYDALLKMLEEAWTEWVYVYRLEDNKWYYTNNPSPTWFKCCGEQRQTALLTPDAWKEEETDDE